MRGSAQQHIFAVKLSRCLAPHRSSCRSTNRSTHEARRKVLTPPHAIIVAALHSNAEAWECALVPVHELGPKHGMRGSISIDDPPQDIVTNPVPLVIVDVLEREGALTEDQVRGGIDVGISLVDEVEVVRCFLFLPCA